MLNKVADNKALGGDIINLIKYLKIVLNYRQNCISTLTDFR